MGIEKRPTLFAQSDIGNPINSVLVVSPPFAPRVGQLPQQVHPECSESQHYSQMIYRSTENSPLALQATGKAMAGDLFITPISANKRVVIITDLESPQACVFTATDEDGTIDIPDEPIGWSINGERLLSLNDIFGNPELHAVIIQGYSNSRGSDGKIGEKLRALNTLTTIYAGAPDDYRYSEWGVTYDALSQKLRIHSWNSDRFIDVSFSKVEDNIAKPPEQQPILAKYMYYLKQGGALDFISFKNLLTLKPVEIHKRYPASQQLIIRSDIELWEEDYISQMPYSREKDLRQSGFNYGINLRVARQLTEACIGHTGIELTDQQEELFTKCRLMQPKNGTVIYKYGFIPTEEGASCEQRNFLYPWEMGEIGLLGEILKITGDREGITSLNKLIEAHYPPNETLFDHDKGIADPPLP